MKNYLVLGVVFLSLLTSGILPAQSLHFEDDGREFEDGHRRILENVRFKMGKAELDTEKATQLDSLILLLVVHPEWSVEIGVHMDNRGTPKMCQRLTDKRAQSIAAYLTERGIPTAQVRAVGYGESMPFFPDKPKEMGMKNNRVDWRVISH